MTEKQPLRSRLVEELTADVTVGVVAAIGAVVVAAIYYWLGVSFVGSFLAMITIGVELPHAYDRHWPITYASRPAVVWTVAATLVTAGVFLGVYQLAALLGSGMTVPITAFFVTALLQYVMAMVFGRAYRQG
ncbi:hypothetical protein [Halocatena halophila]|uniref:hypothetical protein n=1 Tax=Halocatena halophila TaxID=2814576 RepID=UPI002ED2F96E